MEEGIFKVRTLKFNNIKKCPVNILFSLIIKKCVNNKIMIFSSM